MARAQVRYVFLEASAVLKEAINLLQLTYQSQGVIVESLGVLDHRCEGFHFLYLDSTAEEISSKSAILSNCFDGEAFVLEGFVSSLRSLLFLGPQCS